jgi:RNA polymerase sigma factor for flagellar operon FliA
MGARESRTSKQRFSHPARSEDPAWDDELWRDFKATGSRLARDRLVLAFRPLVRHVALRTKQRLPACVDLDDLVSDGYLGLMDAVDKFEPDRNVPFRAYAVPRIRGAILDGLRAADWVPRSVRRRIGVLRVATADVQLRQGRRPFDAEIAAEIGISGARLRDTQAHTRRSHLVSLDGAGLGDRLTPHAVEGLPGGDVELRTGLLEAMRQLPPREQRVLALSHWERLTLTEIGQVMSISESRVCQLRTRATTALRRALGPVLDSG